MYAAVSREMRRAHGRARGMSRRVAREAKSVAPKSSAAMYVVGGVGVLAIGLLAWNAWGKPKTIPGVPVVPPPAPGTTPAPTPAPTPASAPTPPAGAAAVNWSDSAKPWAPPSAPTSLPTGFTVNDDLSSVDPMFVAMAQSALQILSRLPLGTGGNPLTIAYAAPIDGNISVAFTESLIGFQASMSAATGAIAGYQGVKPRTDGKLDAKSLALLITYAMQAAFASGSPIVPTYTGDPVLMQMAVNALTNMVNTPTMAPLVPGVTLPINLNSALPIFQGVMAKTLSSLPTTGLVNTQIDWATWGLAVGISG